PSPAMASKTIKTPGTFANLLTGFITIYQYYNRFKVLTDNLQNYFNFPKNQPEHTILSFGIVV
ncbi:MAG: hypothetical protein JXA03_12830, partial [Bacteroidales bacterium]|nr:hypothetical protein [Bacteroidales bacterium]